jgi:UDP-GlcNAc:undecaprenyl-phosphate GlcNAc-1-phosphate transferase
MWMWAALVAFGTVVVSLYTGNLMWAALAVATAVTITLTFVVPVVHTPHLSHHDDA